MLRGEYSFGVGDASLRTKYRRRLKNECRLTPETGRSTLDRGSDMCVCILSYSVMSSSLQPHRL